MGIVHVNIRAALNNRATDVENGGRPAARWSLRLIGGFEITEFPGGQKVALPGKRERALLAFLALSPKGRQPRRKLAALLWGDTTDETLLDNLRTCVWRLRKALGDTGHHVLASDEEEIVLDLAAFDIDVLAFRRLAARPERPEQEAAAGYCSGELLSGLVLDSDAFESWRRLEASCHLNQAVEVLSRLMRLASDGGEAERALELGSRILGLDPLHEETARWMMRLYADSGRRGAAIQLYRTLHEALRREVDTQPEAETRQIFDAISRIGETDGLNPSWSPAIPNAGIEANAGKKRSISRAGRFRIAALLLGLIAVALGSYWLLSRRSPDLSASHAAPAARPLAIAVLPFDNLSGDPAQQYFSDGMTEEISTALAKVPGLELIARTSAYQFRGNKDARQVGTVLGARYVLEGAVRRMDNVVRITAQLIRTDTGRLVWSETYERQLTGIFAIQEDIAKAIATELRLSITSPSGGSLVSNRDIDATAYEEFLRARPLIRARQTGVEQAIQILEPLVARNPNFAPAWALLAQAYAMMGARASPYTTVPGHPDILQRTVLIGKYWPKSEAASRRAIQLDPKLPEGYYALGQLMSHRGKFALANDLYSKALALDRYNPDALGLRMNLLADTGFIPKAAAVAEELLALDPYVPTWKQDAAEVLWAAGQKDRPVQLLKSIMERPSVPTSLAMIYASEGRYAEAADLMDATLKVRGEMRQNQSELWRAGIAVLRIAPAKIAIEHDFPKLGRVDWAYLYVGAPEQALEHYESDVRSGMVGGPAAFGWLWHSSYAVARKSARFKALVKDAGLVDFWRQRGWPDFCHPLGSSDFECH